MELDRVTITGADDSVDVNDLLAISKDFPFVEWGILFSAGKPPRPRFPSAGWLHKLIMLHYESPLSLSMHLCGRHISGLQEPGYKRNFVLQGLYKIFSRVQLNFHGEPVPESSWKPLAENLNEWHDWRPKTQFIFQADGVNNDLLGDVLGIAEDSPRYFDGVILFDCSHGAGVSPESWPEPLYYESDVRMAYHGYAGGLGPDNLAAEIPRIEAVADNCRTWIDMETKVRSDDDKTFDLAKVRQCLEICSPFVHSGEVANG